LKAKISHFDGSSLGFQFDFERVSRRLRMHQVELVFRGGEKTGERLSIFKA
jgi:hypothetical protein